MKSCQIYTLLLSVLLGVTALLVPASAEAEYCPLPSDPATIVGVIFPLADTNRDGSLSAAELSALYPMAGMLYTYLDLNKDGRIDQAELTAILMAFSSDPLSLVDSNGNDVIEFSEVSGYVNAAQFAMIDRDGNQVIDCSDLNAIVPGEGEGEPSEGEPEEGETEAACPLPMDIVPQLVGLLFPLVDANGSGGLSLAEIQALYEDVPAQYFSLADFNRSGEIEVSELLSVAQALGIDLVAEIDGNGDRVIEYQETAGYLSPAQFALLDANGNGVVDCGDLDSIILPVEGEAEGEPEGEPAEGEPAEGEPETPCPLPVDIVPQLVGLLFPLVDADGSGGLSLAEIQALYADVPTQYFPLVDFDRSGEIEAAELQSIAGALGVDLVAQIDTNGNRLIELSETAGYVSQTQFALIDRNGNGVVDCADLDAILPGEGETEGEPSEGEAEGEDPVEGEPELPCPLPDVTPMIIELVFPLLDGNNDGGVSLAEIQVLYADIDPSYFSLVDFNRDGKVSLSELNMIVTILPAGGVLGLIDTNLNSLIEYAEVSEWIPEQIFNGLDFNHNSVIDCADLDVLLGNIDPPDPGEGETEGEPSTGCQLLSSLPALLGVAVDLLDLDNDGGLSLAELQRVYADIPASYFSIADPNGDGVADQFELARLVNMIPALLPGGNPLSFVDTNNNGVIEYAEVAQFVTPEQFAWADRDGNGVFDCDDLNAIIVDPVEGEPEGEPSEGETEGETGPGCPLPNVAALLPELALALLDTDNDGGVSMAEISAVYTGLEPAYFRIADRNGDGRVDRLELAALVNILPAVLPGDPLAEIDANGNRVIEYAEVSAYVSPEMFARLDRNGDGMVDCADIALIIGPPIDPEGETEGEPAEGEPSEGETEGEPVAGCPLPEIMPALPDMVIALVDADNDGAVSFAEVAAVYSGLQQYHFAFADRNGDGVIDRAELAAVVVILPTLAVIPPDPLNAIDANGNRVIEYTEVAGYVSPALFARIDLNGDGVFDCADLAALLNDPAEGETEGEPAEGESEGEATAEGEVTVEGETEGEPAEGESEGEATVEGEGEGPGLTLEELLARLRGSGNLAELIADGFALLDANGDGAISLGEATSRIRLPQAVFNTLDTNGDGGVTMAEIEALLGQTAQNPGQILRLVRQVTGRYDSQFFTPGQVLRVTLRLLKEGPVALNEVRLLELLPEGWTIQNILDGYGKSLLTNAKVDGNMLLLTWAADVKFPVEITYEAVAPAGASGVMTVSGQADCVDANGAAGSTGVVASILAEALPGELAHSADSNRDWRLSLSEVLRVVQLYNAGVYGAAGDTEDGFVPGGGNRAGGAHNADTNASWDIDISELLRVVQLFNSRMGAYYVDAAGEDGFVPGLF